MIYYSHINEDNLVEIQRLQTGNFQKLFCVAGSGERVIALLGNAPLEDVFVVDVNVEALYLTSLKLKAIQYLSAEDYLFFIGATQSAEKNRLSIFRTLAPHLSTECCLYWEKNTTGIAKGILYSGHFEHFLANIRFIIKNWLGESFYEQFQVSDKKLEGLVSWRWGILKFFFRQRLTYRIFRNKDMAFIGPSAALSLIPEAIDKTIIERRFRESFMNHLIFEGNLSLMPKEHLPFSVSPDFLLKVKKNLQVSKIHFIHSDFLSALKNTDDHYFQNAFFSLSDLLSFESYDYIRQILSQIQLKSATPSKALLRSFIRNRIDINTIHEILKPYGKVKDYSQFERTGMYQVFEIDIDHEKR